MPVLHKVEMLYVHSVVAAVVGFAGFAVEQEKLAVVAVGFSWTSS